MAGSIFTSFGAGDANATAFMTHLTAMTKGYNALSLTNMDNTTVPAIAAGSLIENNGALFKFDAEEAISTTDPVTSSTVADGTVYIMLVPSGSSISACFTATAPTWSDSKQGWYGTSTYANNRYLSIIITKASSSYTKHVLLNDRSLNGIINYKNGQFSTPSINTNSIIGNIGLFTGVYILTGTLGSGITNISYPSGFTKENSVILSIMVQDSVTNYTTPGVVATEYTLNGTLSASYIIINPGTEYYNRGYRLVIGKIS